ncbi:uncharacterized protein LOC110892485 [Helianthus annuus]|uniref:uncharacterized protein LOC110892485 n=1 Tax=Helianthus annuus TaxID=4232 RepID=UPI000B8EFA51|nr:uncharacterized protein LOC110892485 [Helianthus annuus]
MSKRSKGQRSTSNNAPTIIYNANNHIQRYPLYDVSNASVLNTKSVEAAHRRKLRKQYLDTKKSNGTERGYPLANISNYLNPNTIKMEATYRRKLRKLYLDNKRKNTTSALLKDPTNSSTQYATQSSNNQRYCVPSASVRSTNNAIRDVLISPVSCVSNAPVLRTPLSNITNVAIPSTSNIEPAHMRKLRKLHLDSRRSNTISPSSNLNLNSSLNLTTPSSDNRQTSISSNRVASTSDSTLTEDFSLRRLPSRKRKSVTNSRITSPIPMFDLTLDGQFSIQEIIEDPSKGISKDYLDHGDQTVTCEMCNAKLWEHKASRSQDMHGKTTYLQCCAYGKVELPPYKDARANYKSLFLSADSKSKYFLKNIRRFNSMFSFTSMGGKVDNKINRGNAPYVYRLSGQNYHSMGSLLPEDGDEPKFSQLYIYDTENEVENRKNLFSGSNSSSSSNSDVLDREIINHLKSMLDSDNAYVKSYRMVRDCFKENTHVQIKLRLIGKRDKDGRTFNLPTAPEVAALIVGDIDKDFEKRDIIVETKTGRLKRISELHASYLPLQYPLLFPYGDDGYRVDILHRDVISVEKSKRPTCTMREFFAYRIQDRQNYFSLILNSRRLFQQFLVDAYTMIESERLNFIRSQQKVLRADTYDNLSNLQDVEDTNMAKNGQRVILPSSFTGGSRYMTQNYLDAMSLCKCYGYPDFFITITCNPKWPEVSRFLKDTTVNPVDRPDILCRLFKIKLDAIIKDIKDNSLFGKVDAVVYTVEFQKRGLPHAHICLFMNLNDKLHTVEHVDPFISAEIPNKDEDHELYSLVREFMIHGPCGSYNMNCPCMIDKKCSKNFPKKFSDYTSLDANGFPLYRRRDSGSFIEKSGVKLDNRSVVPYNKKLLKRYQAHINVEWCCADKATFAVIHSNRLQDQDKPKDEIKEYYDCRYLSACEASWRIFAYDIHYRYPSIMRLSFHLPGQQQVIYGADDDIDIILNKPTVGSSMFLSWMECNQKDVPGARKLTYVEFPSKFVWKLEKRCWKPRIKGVSIGRIHSAPHSLGEAYFLRILLNKVRGPKSFEDIRTVNREVFPTFRDACYALGLLDDDAEYIEAIKEASFDGSGFYVRALFATMLLSNTLSRPDFVWENTWKYLSDDIVYRQAKIFRGVSVPDA